MRRRHALRCLKLLEREEIALVSITDPLLTERCPDARHPPWEGDHHEEETNDDQHQRLLTPAFDKLRREETTSRCPGGGDPTDERHETASLSAGELLEDHAPADRVHERADQRQE